MKSHNLTYIGAKSASVAILWKHVQKTRLTRIFLKATMFFIKGHLAASAEEQKRRRVYGSKRYIKVCAKKCHRNCFFFVVVVYHFLNASLMHALINCTCVDLRIMPSGTCSCILIAGFIFPTCPFLKSTSPKIQHFEHTKSC